MLGDVTQPVADHSGSHLYPHTPEQLPADTQPHLITLLSYQDNAARTGLEQGVVQAALGQRHQLSKVVRSELFGVLGDDAAVCEVVCDLRRGGGRQTSFVRLSPRFPYTAPSPPPTPSQSLR